MGQNEHEQKDIPVNPVDCRQRSRTPGCTQWLRAELPLKKFIAAVDEGVDLSTDVQALTGSLENPSMACQDSMFNVERWIYCSISFNS
jgi:hypothetical protein